MALKQADISNVQPCIPVIAELQKAFRRLPLRFGRSAQGLGGQRRAPAHAGTGRGPLRRDPHPSDPAQRTQAAAWKSALSVLVGLYPTAVPITLGLDDAWPDAALLIGLLIGSALSVALGAAVSIAFLTVAAAAFWLLTTQVWSLP